MNAYPLPLTMATIQLGAGLLWILPVWLLGFRPMPVLTTSSFKALAPIAFFHTVGHTMTVVSLGAGAVSFTHIVKAAEPFFSTIIQAIMGNVAPMTVNLCLIPVVGGVAIASMKELSFTWTSFGGAMGSNLSFALRGIFSKKAMSAPVGEHMGPANLFAVLTIMSFTAMLPVCIYFEGSNMSPSLSAAYDHYGSSDKFLTEVLFAGLFYYLYNEVAYLALGAVDSPTTHAVGNTLKRVVVMVASAVYFKDKMTGQAMGGCAIAIGGVMMYSLASSKAKRKVKKV
jgi:solute carrier family 35, member E1